MRPRPFSPSSSVTSRPTVSSPASTASCAMPAPIVPRPTTPTFMWRSTRRIRELLVQVADLRDRRLELRIGDLAGLDQLEGRLPELAVRLPELTLLLDVLDALFRLRDRLVRGLLRLVEETHRSCLLVR